MKHQSKQKQVKKIEDAKKGAANKGQVARAKSAQCAMKCPKCMQMMSDEVMSKRHWEAKHEGKKVAGVKIGPFVAADWKA